MMTQEPFWTTPHLIPWERENPDGTRAATLIGSRRPGELFTYAFWIPAGTADAPHLHGPDIHLVVATGELWLAWGDDATRDDARRYPVGSLLHVPGGTVHADGADVDTLIYGTAVGPWSTTYAG